MTLWNAVPKPKARPKVAKPLRAKGGRRFPGRENPQALEAVRALPCAVCTHLGLVQQSPTEVEHWVPKSRGGYDLGDTFPTCAEHRELRHTRGDESFERVTGLSGRALCEETWGQIGRARAYRVPSP